jgi:hypothetical protein
VSPYSGSSVIASNSAEPSLSYRYFDGSSFWPLRLKPLRTSSANCFWAGIPGRLENRHDGLLLVTCFQICVIRQTAGVTFLLFV